MIVSFRGVQEFMIRCARGVKQGCPLSGLIWALCFDPIIRKMKFELSGFQVRLGVFADDLGLAARHFFQCFPVVMKEFALVLQAAGLKVNTHKTYIIIYADLTKAQVLEKMNAAGVEEEDFKIVAAARYLGLFLGFNSAEASWAHPIAEFRKRIYHVKSLKLGLLASLSAYNMVCFSVLSFVGQFLPPPQEALRTVREGLQSLTNGPRHAFPPLVLQHLKEIGAPVEPRHLELECRAAAYRLAVRSPQVYLERLAWEEAEADDERVLAPKYRAWVNQSIFMHLSKVQEELEVVHRCPYDHVESNLQRKVYKLLYSRSQIPSMPQLLLPRLQHFDPSATIADADRMFLNISTLARDLPFFITTAQLRSICNGWCTTRRFRHNGGGTGNCRFGCMAVGGDSVLHYYACPVAVNALKQLVPSLPACFSDIPPLHRLLLHKVCFDSRRQLHALGLSSDLLLTSFNALRARDRISAPQTFSLMEARCRAVAKTDSSVRALLQPHGEAG
eukprot:4151429-Pyramimonas_sp.AAC.1